MSSYIGRPPIGDEFSHLDVAGASPPPPPTAPPPPPAAEPMEKPYTLLDFARMFATEQACADYLFKVRWPNGFACPKCGDTRYFPAGDKPGTVQCVSGDHRTSITAGTIMHGSRQPLTLWFHAAYLVATLTPGISALQFQRQLGIKRYETAYNLLHKLRAGLVDPDREKLKGEIEVDETYIGGAETGRPGRGSETKALVVCAVEAIRWLDTKSKRKEREQAVIRLGDLPTPGSHGVDDAGAAGVWRRRAGRIRLTVIPDASAETLLPWVESNVARTFEDDNGETRPTMDLTDGWPSYNGLGTLGYMHAPILQTRKGKSTGEFLPLVHLIISNLERWLMGTHKGAVLPKHLQAYLNEFTFRFNRRFWRGPAFLRALGLAVTAEERPEYDTLYHAGEEGGWVHPNPDTDAVVWGLIVDRYKASGDTDMLAWMDANQPELLKLVRETRRKVDAGEIKL